MYDMIMLQKLVLLYTFISPSIVSHSSAVKLDAVAAGLSFLKALLSGDNSLRRFSQNSVSSG